MTEPRDRSEGGAAAVVRLDPAQEAHVRGLFDRAPFVRKLGIAVVDVAAGHVVSELVVRDAHRQQDGYVHAGVLATLADHTAGACGTTDPRAPAGTEVLSVTFTVGLLRPARGPRLRCVARAVRLGRSLAVVDADVYDEEDGKTARHVTHATVTLALRSPEASR